MFDKLQSGLANLSLVRLSTAAEVIREALDSGLGIRLGQCTVLSNKVHAFNADSPEHLQIMTNADAGQVFYCRQDRNAIGHLDIFHECGLVDHQLAASYVCSALGAYSVFAEQGTIFGFVNPDFVDIQTATGGGRITGHLRGGYKPSLRRVHENHVHIAFLLPSGNLSCLFYIVAAVETAILEQGFELRCNERISYVATDEYQVDLSPYNEISDSLLAG